MIPCSVIQTTVFIVIPDQYVVEGDNDLTGWILFIVVLILTLADDVNEGLDLRCSGSIQWPADWSVFIVVVAIDPAGLLLLLHTFADWRAWLLLHTRCDDNSLSFALRLPRYARLHHTLPAVS